MPKNDVNGVGHKKLEQKLLKRKRKKKSNKEVSKLLQLCSDRESNKIQLCPLFSNYTITSQTNPYRSRFGFDPVFCMNEIEH